MIISSIAASNSKAFRDRSGLVSNRNRSDLCFPDVARSQIKFCLIERNRRSRFGLRFPYGKLDLCPNIVKLCFELDINSSMTISFLPAAFEKPNRSAPRRIFVGIDTTNRAAADVAAAFPKGERSDALPRDPFPFASKLPPPNRKRFRGFGRRSSLRFIRR